MSQLEFRERHWPSRSGLFFISQNGDSTSSKPQKPKMQSKSQEGSRSSTVSQDGPGDIECRDTRTLSEHLVGSPASSSDRTEQAKLADEATSYNSLSSAINSTYLPPPNMSSSSACPNNVSSTGFVTGSDFIAFDFSEDEAEEDRPLQISPGKGKEREGAVRVVRQKQNGLKRSAEQMEAGGSGYANKAQRADAISRLTPWMRNVDWDNCRNLAEMCVYFVVGLR